jgi:tyrosyl-tRNA synthetase
LVHGRVAADEAAKTAQTTFEQGGMGDNLPTAAVIIGDGVLATSTKLGFTTSNSQARQFVKDGAVYLGEKKITDPNYRLQNEDFDQNGRVMLRMGAKKRAILTRG